MLIFIIIGFIIVDIVFLFCACQISGKYSENEKK